MGQVTSCFSCLLVGVVRPTLPGVRRIQSPHVVSGKRLRWYLLAMTAVLSLQGAGGMDVLTLARQADGPAPSPSEPQGLDGLLSSSCLHLGLNTPSDGGSLLARGAWPVVNTISSVPSPNLCLVASTHRQRWDRGSWATPVLVVEPLLEDDCPPLTPSCAAGERTHLHCHSGACAQMVQLLLWEEGCGGFHVQGVVRLPWLRHSVFTCPGRFRPSVDTCARVCAQLFPTRTGHGEDPLPQSRPRIWERGSGMPAGGEGSQSSREGPASPQRPETAEPPAPGPAGQGGWVRRGNRLH